MYRELVKRVWLRPDSDYKSFTLQVDDESSGVPSETTLSKTQLRKLIKELQEWLATAR